MECKLKKTPEQVLVMTEQAVTYARSLCERVDFSPEDAGRSDLGFSCRSDHVAIDAGADVINIPDTVGYLTPQEFGELITYLITKCDRGQEVIFSTHCHDDLGLAVANSLAGVINGARQIECTINGIGERAGNAALEEVVMGIETRSDFYQLQTNIDTRQIMPTSNLLKKITGQPVQSNKAIVGQNAFAHESGIHQHGFLANPETYEIMKPEDVGAVQSDIILGKHSGRAALEKRLIELGYECDNEKLNHTFVELKKLSDKKKIIEDADLDALMLGKDATNHYQPIEVDIQCGTRSVPSAHIVITVDGKRSEAQASGTGPVDAAFSAIENILGKRGELKEYRMDAVTAGLDAQAVVSLVLETPEGGRFHGRAGDTDIVVASINAYLNALSKLSWHR